MIKKKFKIGDRVYHKSGGGPMMAVKNYEPIDGDEVTCEWFDKNHSLQERSFNQDTLEIYETPEIIVGPRRRSSFW